MRSLYDGLAILLPPMLRHMSMRVLRLCFYQTALASLHCSQIGLDVYMQTCKLLQHPCGMPSCSQCKGGCGLVMQGKKCVHVATVGGDPEHHSSLGKLCSHLAELAKDDHIQLQARLVLGPAHPAMIKAAALPDSHKIQKPLHAEVDILLREKAVLTNGQGIDELAEGKKGKWKGASGRGKKDYTAQSWAANARDMAPVINWLMLADSAGLQIGPDCDGLLNFCDEGHSAAAAVKQDADEGSSGSEGLEAGKAEQGPSDGAADGQKDTAEGQLGATIGGGPEETASMTVQQMLDSVALPDAAPVAVAPRCLRTVPKQFQLQGLQWMLARERQGDALGR